NLSNAANATLANNSGTGTILDDDALLRTSQLDADRYADDERSATRRVGEDRSAASGQTDTVDYATADGHATAGSDYYSTSGTLTFTPGQTTKTVSVQIIGDTLVEPDETFTVNLSSPVHATLATDHGTGTILDDDEPLRTVQLDADSYTVDE